LILWVLGLWNRCRIVPTYPVAEFSSHRHDPSIVGHLTEETSVMTQTAIGALPCVDIHLDDLMMAAFAVPPTDAPGLAAHPPGMDPASVSPARPPRRLAEEEDEDDKDEDEEDDDEDEEDDDEGDEDGDGDEDEDEEDDEDDDDDDDDDGGDEDEKDGADDIEIENDDEDFVPPQRT
jgi:hypothetical protein